MYGGTHYHRKEREREGGREGEREREGGREREREKPTLSVLGLYSGSLALFPDLSLATNDDDVVVCVLLKIAHLTYSGLSQSRVSWR